MSESVAAAKPAVKQRPLWLRAIRGTAVFCAVSTAFIGLMHTRFGLTAYAKVFGGGCPVGRASASDVEHGRLAAVRAIRGSQPSPSRPALGFRLDVTTRAEVDAWVEQHHLQCRERRERTLLICESVPATVFGRPEANIDEVSFAFTPQTLKLVNLTAVRYRLTAQEAVNETGNVTTQLRTALGAPTRMGGTLDANTLSARAYATVAVFYEFSDYIADVTATNIPDQGVLLREHYMSAVDAPGTPASPTAAAARPVATAGQ